MSSFPHYPQFDTKDCGPSCLRMIAQFYGKSYSLESLRERCFITREGVSMLCISEAAESIGMRTLGLKITLEELVHEAVLPCIIHWNQNHFVVLYKIDKDRRSRYRFHISDPASLKLVCSEAEFRKCWISKKEEEVGIVLLLEPGPDFMGMEDENTLARRSLLFFARYLYPYKSPLLQLLLGMLVGSGLQMIFPFLTQSLVDIGIQSSDLAFVTIILIAQLVLFVSQL